MIKALLNRWRKQPRKEPPPPAAIDIEGRTVSVIFRHNPRAKRFIMRLDRTCRGVVVTMPLRASRNEGLAFVNRSAGWITAHLARENLNVAFSNGAGIPLRGELVTIEHQAFRRGTVWFEKDTRKLCVAGGEAHLQRRVADWLKSEARHDLQKVSAKYALAMGVKIRRISIRDQRSRWGSCSAGGSLSYSWRLIMAPTYVLDYVSAHEVAHLRHMNHGMKFWRLVLTHCPVSQKAKAWLKANSTALHRYGREA